jgi:hypothetical protein
MVSIGARVRDGPAGADNIGGDAGETGDCDINAVAAAKTNACADDNLIDMPL